MRIGTRGSALALWQARTVARLIKQTGGPDCEIVIIRTSGDERAGPPDPPARVPDLPGMPDVSGAQGVPRVLSIKRTFVKEIEDALLEGRIDAAVHSSKDLAAALPDGIMIAAALEREDPRDALLLPGGSSVCDFESVKNALGTQPRIGTSSVRRMAELRSLFPAATFSPIRGNVDTRLRKLDAGECDVLVLAAAGVKRLGLASRISTLLPADVCVPAPGQGIVAVEIAESTSRETGQAVARIDDADAAAQLIAERAVVQALGGDCQTPLGVLATVHGQLLEVRGLIASPDGQKIIRASTSGNRGNAAAAGEKLANLLLAKGAAVLLAGG